MFDAKFVFALKDYFQSVHFQRRVSVEEQRAQKCIWEYFRAPRSYEVVQGLIDMFRKRLQDGDVQDFDTRWDQAPQTASEIFSETILEGVCKSKLQDSVQLHSVLAVYEQENVRNNEPPNYSKMETSVRLKNGDISETSEWSGDEDTQLQSSEWQIWKWDSGKTKRKVSVALSVESNRTVFEWRFMQFQSWWSIWKQFDQNQKGQSSSLAPKALTQTDGKKPSMGSGFRGEIFFLKEDRISCLNFLNGKCTNPSRNYWHPPVCLNYNTSLNQVANMATNVQSDIEVDGRPIKSWRKALEKDQLPSLKESILFGCVSQDYYPRKSLRKFGKFGSNHTVTYTKSIWHPVQKFGNERVFFFKSANLVSAIRVRFDHRKNTRQKPCNKKDAPTECGSWLAKNTDNTEFYRRMGNAGALFKKARKKNENLQSTPENQYTRWAKKIWAQMSCGDPGTSHNGGNGHWWSANKQGSTGPCSQSWSLRESWIIRRHAFSSITWRALQGARINMGQSITSAQTREDDSVKRIFAPCYLRIVVKFWCQFVFHITTAHDGEPGNWRDTPEPPFKMKKRDNNWVSGNRLRDLPELLEEFTENFNEVSAYKSGVSVS